MFFEQHSLEPSIGAAWFWLTLIRGGRELQHHAIENWMEKGYRALKVMETHLRTHDFFAADRYTIADIALFAYTHVAHECDFDVTPFRRSAPGSSAWSNSRSTSEWTCPRPPQPSSSDLMAARPRGPSPYFSHWMRLRCSFGVADTASGGESVSGHTIEPPDAGDARRKATRRAG